MPAWIASNPTKAPIAPLIASPIWLPALSPSSPASSSFFSVSSASDPSFPTFSAAFITALVNPLLINWIGFFKDLLNDPIFFSALSPKIFVFLSTSVRLLPRSPFIVFDKVLPTLVADPKESLIFPSALSAALLTSRKVFSTSSSLSLKLSAERPTPLR